MATVTRRRRPCRLGVVVAIVAACSAVPSAQRLPEYQIKAAYLLGLARFVEWPAGSIRPPFAICVVGDDPFGSWLDEATAGAKVKEQPVTVRRLGDADDRGACQVLYVAGSEDGRLARILDPLRTRPVLTVSDVPQFAQRGGMVGFVMDGSRVRFVANPEAAKTAGLQLTSELLRVAVTVLGRRAPEAR